MSPNTRPNPRSSHATQIRELIADLRNAGFALDRQKGSHRQFKHPSFQGVITLNGADGDDARSYQERQIRKAIADSQSPD